jgi:putative transposase
MEPQNGPTITISPNPYLRVFIIISMSIPKRHVAPSQLAAAHRTFFVTTSIHDKRCLLQSSRSAELFMNVLDYYRQQGKFALHEFVIMPDHVHLLLTVSNDISIERAVQFIKGGFAYRAGKELKFDAPVWQKGFSEVRVLDETSYDQFVAYIRNNPVRARLASRPEEFPFSSASNSLELDPRPQGLKPTKIDQSLRYG